MAYPYLHVMAKEILLFVKYHSRAANNRKMANHKLASEALIRVKPLARALIAMSQQRDDGMGTHLYRKKFEALALFMRRQRAQDSEIFAELLNLTVLVPSGSLFDKLTLGEYFRTIEADRKQKEARYSRLKGQSAAFVRGLTEQQKLFLKDFVYAGLTFGRKDFE